jgi:hypothetical protein
VKIEYHLPEGIIRYEIGYPDVIGVTSPGGEMTVERARYVSVFLNGEPVHGERALELISRVNREHGPDR